VSFERRYLRALRAEDPVGALRALAKDRRIAADVRRRLGGADADGVRLTALLVAKLRFERLLNGSREAADWFRRDPAAFTRVFGRYHRAVPQTAFFPKAEARAFDAWLRRRQGPTPAANESTSPRTARGRRA
jgi:hypothetical protein